MVSPSPRRGDIWYVYTPGQPDDPHQPRPAIVMSVNIRNQRADDVIIVPIFSNGRAGPTHITFSADESGLQHDSVIFAEEVTTIDKDFLHDGPHSIIISAELSNRIVDAIAIAIGRQLTS